MKLLLFFSDLMIPLVIFLILLHGLFKRLPVFDIFTKGTDRGFRTVLHTAPTLIGLMTAVSALRACGILDYMEQAFLPFEQLFHFPAKLVPLTFIRLFSTSAATGFLLDIFKEMGPDSFAGLTASLLMSCTEAAFYTMSIYFTSVHVKKTRWTLPGALISSFAGILVSIVLAYYLTV